MTRKVWVVVDIGCIECGESSRILGAYKTEDEARAAHLHGGYFNRGQHFVFSSEIEIPEDDDAIP